MLLDLTLSDLERQNVDRTNCSPLMYRMAKLTPMILLKSTRTSYVECLTVPLHLFVPKWPWLPMSRSCWLAVENMKLLQGCNFTHVLLCSKSGLPPRVAGNRLSSFLAELVLKCRNRCNSLIYISIITAFGIRVTDTVAVSIYLTIPSNVKCILPICLPNIQYKNVCNLCPVLPAIYINRTILGVYMGKNRIDRIAWTSCFSKMIYRTDQILILCFTICTPH